MQINYLGYGLNLCSGKLVKLNIFCSCLIDLFPNSKQIKAGEYVVSCQAKNKISKPEKKIDA